MRRSQHEEIKICSKTKNMRIVLLDELFQMVLRKMRAFVGLVECKWMVFQISF